jgi:hypothetical protein
MIRTVADVAITEVTIWQQCGYNVPRQEGRENEKYLISEYLYRNGASFIIWIINYSYYSTLSVVFIYNCFRKFSLLIFKNWFKFIFVE